MIEICDYCGKSHKVQRTETPLGMFLWCPEVPRHEILIMQEKNTELEKRRELANILLSIAEQFTETNIGHLMGAVALVLESEAEEVFLKENYTFFVKLLDELQEKDGFFDRKLSYEEREFFGKFSELTHYADEDFPDVIL